MNTRSRTRANTTTSATQSSEIIKKATNKEKKLGIKFQEKNQARRFNIPNEREMRTTNWACPSTINRLGIGNDFELLCNNVGIRHFVMQDVLTYRRLTLEFLSTFEHTVQAFHYNDAKKELSSIL